MKESTLNTLDYLLTRYPVLSSCQEDIFGAIQVLVNTYRYGGKVITCGNGGSAADAEHIVGELMKGFVKKRPLASDFAAQLRKIAPQAADYLQQNLQQPLAAISLVAGVALPTAFANDQAGDLVFAQQLLGLGKEGDALLAISTSGNSKNVIYAVQIAKALGTTSIALTGRSGGKLKGLADITIAVPEDETYKIQELHLPLYHALCLAVESEFFDE